MALIRQLNRICAKRHVARAIPAQVACRIFGNNQAPCLLDPICEPCEKVGVWLFYSVFIAVISFLFILIFWVLRITRLQKVIGWIFKFISPPLKWLISTFAAFYNFYRNLPF